MRLDLVDDALDDLRISGSVLLREAYRGDWAIAVPDEAAFQRLLGTRPDQRVVPFHYARRGGFVLRAGEASTSIAVERGELSLVPSGTAHELAAGRRVKATPLASLMAGDGPDGAQDAADATELICGAFVLRAAPLNPLLGALPGMFKVSGEGNRAAPALAGAMALLTSELLRSGGGDFTARRLLEVICADAIRAWVSAHEHTPQGWLRGLQDPKIATALRAIHAAPSQAWSVDTLAAHVSLSPSRFAARFREATGETVMGYVGRWRANLASRLLRESDAPMKFIADLVGYENFPAFSRAFKAHLGVGPAAWRERGRVPPPRDAS